MKLLLLCSLEPDCPSLGGKLRAIVRNKLRQTSFQEDHMLLKMANKFSANISTFIEFYYRPECYTICFISS